MRLEDIFKTRRDLNFDAPVRNADPGDTVRNLTAADDQEHAKIDNMAEHPILGFVAQVGFRLQKEWNPDMWQKNYFIRTEDGEEFWFLGTYYPEGESIDPDHKPIFDELENLFRKGARK